MNAPADGMYTSDRALLAYEDCRLQQERNGGHLTTDDILAAVDRWVPPNSEVRRVNIASLIFKIAETQA